jgi:hypothetical protein
LEQLVQLVVDMTVGIDRPAKVQASPPGWITELSSCFFDQNDGGCMVPGTACVCANCFEITLEKVEDTEGARLGPSCLHLDPGDQISVLFDGPNGHSALGESVDLGDL